MSKLQTLARRAIIHTDQTMLKWLGNSKRGQRFYLQTVQAVELVLLSRGNFSGAKILAKDMPKELETYIHEFVGDQLSEKEKRNLKKDILRCYLSYRFHPSEYFMYDLRRRSLEERGSFLSDLDRWSLLHKKFSQNIHNEILDKYVFYQLAQPFFGREAFKVDGKSKKEDFEAFASRHKHLFVKPLDKFYGIGTYKLTVGEPYSAAEIFQRLTGSDSGSYIVEELIEQHPATASWNESSVNTLRMPSFIDAKGEHHILVPIFRTGRKGHVVDNAGDGGIFAGVDSKTGKLLSIGIDKHGGRFEKHPDSGLTFMGWQLPMWQELVEMCERLHRSLPAHHRYIAFDFALTPKGWVVVEGNWGQLSGQGPANHGIRKEFIEYIS